MMMGRIDFEPLCRADADFGTISVPILGSSQVSAQEMLDNPCREMDFLHR